MNQHSKDDLSNLDVLLEQAGVRDDPGILGLARAAARSGNPIWKERLMKVLSSRLAVASVVHPFAPSPGGMPVAEVLVGAVLMADDSIGAPVTVSVSDMCTGTIILGSTGSGKSALMFGICDQLTRHARVWVFDREDEARSKLARGLRDESFKYVHYRHFARNLLEPMKGESPSEMLNRLLSYWRTELTLGDGSENILARCLHELLDEHRVFDGSKNYPTLWHLQKKLERLKPRLDARERGYWETAHNRISVLLTLMGDVYDHTNGFDISELLNENLVIDMQGISDSHHRFFASDLLSCAMAIKEPGNSETVNIFAIDELHRYARSGPSYDPWEPYLHQVARLGRKRRIGIILSDQVPSQIPGAVMANMSTRMVLKTVNGPCKETVARSMGLSFEQRDWLSEMPPRVAVLHSGMHPRPFVIAIPHISYREPLSQAELQELEAGFLARLTSKPKLRTEVQLGFKGVAEPESKPEPRISKDLLDYMVAIDQRPFIGATQRDTELGINAWAGNRLRKELKERKLATEATVSLGGRGQRILLVELSSEAYRILRDSKVRLARHRGKGGIVHRVWQHKVAEVMEGKGYRCSIEDASTGKAVDVSVDTGEKKLALEICVNGIEKEIRNIARDEGYDEIVILAQDEGTLGRIRKKAEEELGEERMGNVSFELLRDFIRR